MTKRLLYDLTELANWKGNLTGINRVTDELAKRFKDEPNTLFIYWDKPKSSFKKIDIDQYYSTIHPANRAFKITSIQNGRDVEPALDSKGILYQLAKKVAHVLKPILWVVIASRKILSKLKNLRQHKIFRKTLSPINFSSDDTIFVPYGTWGDADYISTLSSFKEDVGGRLVFIAHDIMPITIPHFSGEWTKPLTNFTQHITSKADLVLAVSKNTKDDLTNYLKNQSLNLPKIEVIRLGDTFISNELKEPLNNKVYLEKIKENNFILCTGTLEARKNQTILYYTYKLAKARSVKLPQLAIVGREGYGSENIINFLKKDPEVNQQIAILSNITDAELAWLYKNCKFSIYPSFYEGWGLPIAESLAAGVPSVCSNSTSMKEVAPETTPMFNPASTDECLEQIINMLDPKKYQSSLKKARSYKPTSWDQTYSQVVKLMNK